MKKVLLVLVAIAIATPAMAAITITGTGGVLTGTVGYSGNGTAVKPDPARASAFALTLTASGGAKFLTVSPTRNTVSTAAAPGYGIFPGSIKIDSTGAVTAVGTPVEAATLPGAASTGIGTSSIVVALGALYSADADKPGATGNLFTFTTDNACTVTVAVESTYRGGVVAEDASTMTVNLPAGIVVLPNTPTECVKSTAACYADWVAWGKPTCWCYSRACRGDINGTKTVSGVWVSSSDLNVFKLAYNKNATDLALVTNGICADNTRTKTVAGVWVSSSDLNNFKAYYNQPEASVPVCDQTNYNFWSN